MATTARLIALPQQQELPHVVGSVAALRNLPHMTILKVQSGSAAQVINQDRKSVV